MNEKFDELTKGLAQSTTRRQALKRFGAGLAGFAFAFLRLTSKADARNAYVCCKYDCGAGLTVPHCVSASQGCPGSWMFPFGNQGSCPLISATPVKSCKYCPAK